MKFLNFLKAKDKEPEEPLTQIGETDSICPYCQTRLDNMPTRKKKCPSCKEDIFVRTRPLDEKKILIKSSQIDEVEKQWAIKNGDLEQYYAKIKHREEREQRFESKKEQLRNQFGYEPKENDIQWALYNEDRIVTAGDGEWAIYSSTTMHMGNQLKKEKKFRQALTLYLEVIYVDINQLTNMGFFRTDEKYIKEYEETWGRKYEHIDPGLPPAIITHIKKIQKIENIGMIELKDLFIQHNKIYAHSNLKPIVTPEDAWTIFIKDYEKDKIND